MTPHCYSWASFYPRLPLPLSSDKPNKEQSRLSVSLKARDIFFLMEAPKKALQHINIFAQINTLHRTGPSQASWPCPSLWPGHQQQARSPLADFNTWQQSPGQPWLRVIAGLPCFQEASVLCGTVECLTWTQGAATESTFFFLVGWVYEHGPAPTSRVNIFERLVECRHDLCPVDLPPILIAHSRK